MSGYTLERTFIKEMEKGKKLALKLCEIQQKCPQLMVWSKNAHDFNKLVKKCSVLLIIGLEMPLLLLRACLDWLLAFHI